jgi:hypothetical protein
VPSPPNLEIVKKLLIVLGNVLGVYLFVRALAEPFVVNMSNPSTYHLDWGGPSLAGVLAVHCGPGLLYAAGVAWWLVGRRDRDTRRVARSRVRS